MSTLGLSGSSEPAEGLWKGLFWPAIENAQDADLSATRGFWICTVLALVSSPLGSGSTSLFIGFNFTSSLDIAIFIFYVLGAVGVRQASLSAAASMFGTYLLGTILYFWLSPMHFSFLRLICLALLLTNLRAAFLIHRWRKDPLRTEEFADGPTRSNSTLRDKFVDQMAALVWPWGRVIFYVIAAFLIPIEGIGIGAILLHRS